MIRLGIIGYPLEHSQSAEYFSHKFEQEHIDGAYRLYPIRQIEEAVPLISELDGLNVTSPYKEAVIPLLDHLDDSAKEMGAVNVICRGVGYNTDWLGFYQSLKPLLLTEDTQALVLGTGGAAKAVCYALKKMRIPYKMVSRIPKENMIAYTDIDAKMMEEYRLIINCTPLGMLPNTDSCPGIPYNYITPKHLLFDCIYNPAKTLFLQRGEAQGARIMNGKTMHTSQAEAAWKIWNQER